MIEQQIRPAFTEKNIPIVFSTDDNFVPYLATAIQSLVNNSSPYNNYDIILLEENLTNQHKQRLHAYSQKNISIRFINMKNYMEHYKDVWYIHNWGDNKWHSLSVYYRFFIPELFKKYEKIIFLDGDIIINTDIAELYHINLKQNLIGAVQDYARNVTGDVIADYAEKVLGVKRDKYFNAGILLFNLKELAKTNFLEKCINTLKVIGKPKLQDQDVFNVVFKNKILYLDYSWNCLFWNVIFCRANAKDHLSPRLYELWERIAQSPKIFHYAGKRKPWYEPNLEYSSTFWQYARMTSFYEEILARLVVFQIRQNSSQNYNNLIPYAINYHRDSFKYLKYKILSKITFGKMREHYKKKRKELKTRLKDVRKFLKNN